MLKNLKEFMGGFRIGNLDSLQPIASLGDTPPKDQGTRDNRAVGLTAQDKDPTDKDSKKIQKKNSPVKETLSPFKKKILQKISKPIKDYNKKKEKKEDGMTGPGLGTYEPVGDVSTKRLKKEDTNRVPRKPGQPAGSDKHSDLYTDENPKGTIQGLGFTDAETARTSVNKIKNSGKSHAHKIQAAIAMSQRAKVASERAKDPKKKKDLAAAHKIYQSFIDTNKKKD